MKQLFVCLVVAFLPFTLGCFEDDSAWMPDSSAVVFIRSDGVLVVHDLDDGRSRVIANLKCTLRTGPYERPAVHPDGTLIAVVRHTVEGRRQEARIEVFDLQGNRTAVSPVYQLPDATAEQAGRVEWLGRAHWSRDGQWLLCTLCGEFSFPPGLDDPTQVNLEKLDPTVMCLYDFRNRHWRVIPGLKEALVTVLFGTSPFSADGRGFVADLKVLPDGPGADRISETRFVDWTGRQFPFRLSTRAKAAFEEHESQEDQAEAESISPARWDSSRLIMPLLEGELVLDVINLVADYRRTDDQRAIATYARAAGMIVIQLADGVLLQSHTDRPDGKRREILEVVVRDRDNRWSTSVVRTVDDFEGVVCSPNKQLFLIHHKTAGSTGRIVINRQGHIVAQLD